MPASIFFQIKALFEKIFIAQRKCMLL